MVAVLYACRSSVYRTLPGLDVWGEDRDARNWPGGCAVIAHPPCRGWGKLAHFAKIAPGELDLARHAVAMVRRWGGVLEHPRGSRLWADQGLPRPGAAADAFGGFSIAVRQLDFGHRAEKATWLYIVGLSPRQLPAIPLRMVQPETDVEHMGRPERERTPIKLAEWLVAVAQTAGGRAR